MPKLLLVGLVERVCLKTVVREIPGITDCFMNEEDGKNGQKIYSVGPPLIGLSLALHRFLTSQRDRAAAHHQWFKHIRLVAIRLRLWREYH